MYFDLINFEQWLKQQLYEQNLTITKLAKISGVTKLLIR